MIRGLGKRIKKWWNCIWEFLFHPVRVIDKSLFRRWSGWKGAIFQFGLTIILLLVIAYAVTRLRSAIVDAGTRYGDRCWGLVQTSSPAGLCSTIDRMDDMSGKNVSAWSLWAVLGISVLAWLLGAVVLSFWNGLIVNWYNGRRELVDRGHVRYHFSRHGIVIGWDFQGVASVLALLNQYGCKDVVILSEQFASKIRNALDNELADDDMKRIYIYNGSVGVEDRKSVV